MTGADSDVALDVFGLTDRGRVRDGNEDHFLVAQVNRWIDVRQTSLSPAAVAHQFGHGMGGTMLAVADGVGGRAEGELASERTLAAMLQYMRRAASCFQSLDTDEEHALLEKLEEVVRNVHDALIEEYGGVSARLPATTLTMVLIAWPRAYHVHVGDSRAYVRRGGTLQRLTRDQSFGEFMTSVGAWTDEQARLASTAETLASAIGGSELTPVVGLIDLVPGDSLLLCTDGLTKHVSDEEISQALARPESAESTARALVRDALERGGSDNVTVVVVRTTAADE